MMPPERAQPNRTKRLPAAARTGRVTVTPASGVSWLIRPPRWRSESAFADALCLPIRSQARSFNTSFGCAERGAEDRGLGHLVAGELGDDLAAAHDQDAVRQAEHFFDVGGDDEHADPRLGQRGKQLV